MNRVKKLKQMKTSVEKILAKEQLTEWIDSEVLRKAWAALDTGKKDTELDDKNSKIAASINTLLTAARRQKQAADEQRKKAEAAAEELKKEQAAQAAEDLKAEDDRRDDGKQEAEEMKVANQSDDMDAMDIDEAPSEAGHHEEESLETSKAAL